jgi:hypothetical protein
MMLKGYSVAVFIFPIKKDIILVAQYNWVYLLYKHTLEILY